MRYVARVSPVAKDEVYAQETLDGLCGRKMMVRMAIEGGGVARVQSTIGCAWVEDGWLMVDVEVPDER